MKFQSSFVTFFYCKLQWVISGVLAGMSCKTFCKGLNCRRVDNVSPKTGLKKYSIEISCL